MQRAGHRLALLAGHLLQHLHFAQYGARLIDQQQTGLREQHFAAGAFQQHNAQFIFKFTDLSAQRGLADMTGIGGTPKMTMFSEGNQVFKITNIHFILRATIARGNE